MANNPKRLQDPTEAAMSAIQEALNGSPVTVHRYVEDVDSAFARAVAAGATVTMPVADMFWGDRYGVLQDPFGHKWSLATHLRDATAEEMQAGMAKM